MQFNFVVRSEDQVDLKDDTGLVWSNHASMVDGLIMVREMRAEDAKSITDMRAKLDEMQMDLKETEERADALLELEAWYEAQLREATEHKPL